MSPRSILLVCLHCLAACGSELAKPPGVLLITLDTTRADALSCYGGDPRNTPNLDALAERSCLFTHAFSETNVTLPSHVTILSGQPAIRHGVLNNASRVPRSLSTLPARLASRGYRSAGFVSAPHLGPEVGWSGFTELAEPAQDARADRVTDLALAWLDGAAESERPFFLWTHYFDPHAHYDPPDEIRLAYAPDSEPLRVARAGGGSSVNQRAADALKLGGEHARAMYSAEVHFMDREIGRLLAAVHRMAPETIIVVVADHGECIGEHDLINSHRGLYEQILRIPLIFHVPGSSPRRSGHPASTLDVVPTLTSLLGLPTTGELPGTDLAPIVLAGGDVPDPGAFVHMSDHNRMVAVRLAGWKLIWPIGGQERRPALFFLPEDPEELDDLAARHPEKVAELREHLAPWITLGVRRNRDLDEDLLEELRDLGYLGY